MEPPWFYCPDLTPGTVMLPADESRHALTSLRLSPGAPVIVFDGAGHWGRGVLTTPSGPAGSGRGKRPTIAAVEISETHLQSPPACQLTLLVPGCKGARLDWLVEKCTELGASRFILANFARSTVHISDKHIERLQRVALAACKQCGRARRPAFAVATSVPEALADSTESGPVLYGDPAATRSLGEFITTGKTTLRPATAVIGPEGGFTDDEMAHLEQLKAAAIRIGPRVLRVETAAVAVAATFAAHAHGPA
jgi:16S rRNA (uracil1498-N3)-methyltransferase